MPRAEFEIGGVDRQQEEARLVALISAEILDTPPEPAYDAITRLAAEYFHADSARLGFADESRIWIKSCWGLKVREMPRKDSIFNLVLAEDGPVVVPDISIHPHRERLSSRLRQLPCGFFCQRSRALLRRKDPRSFDHLQQ